MHHQPSDDEGERRRSKHHQAAVQHPPDKHTPRSIAEAPTRRTDANHTTENSGEALAGDGFKQDAGMAIITRYPRRSVMELLPRPRGYLSIMMIAMNKSGGTDDTTATVAVVDSPRQTKDLVVLD